MSLLHAPKPQRKAHPAHHEVHPHPPAHPRPGQLLVPQPDQNAPEDQEGKRQAGEQALHALRMASTSPSTLNCSATTVGLSPSSSNVAVVIGPMLAIFTPSSLSRNPSPRRPAKCLAVDDEVNVTQCTRRWSIASSSSAGSDAAGRVSYTATSRTSAAPP